MSVLFRLNTQFNKCLVVSKHIRNYSQLNGSTHRHQQNMFMISLSNNSNVGISLPILRKENDDNNKNNSTNKISYICPSSILFKLPLEDLKISDKIKRHELNLPEINKNRFFYDPLLINQLEENKLPERFSTSVPMSCGKPLYNERSWRSRMMNKKKRQKYQKKMFYVLQKRRQDKEKRYQNLCLMYKQIQEKKSEIYDPLRYIHRELEKAKFFGYRCTPIYDEFRDLVNNNLKSVDDKLTRKFEDIKKPYHMIYTDVIKPEERVDSSASVTKKGSKK